MLSIWFIGLGIQDISACINCGGLEPRWFEIWLEYPRMQTLINLMK